MPGIWLERDRVYFNCPILPPGLGTVDQDGRVNHTTHRPILPTVDIEVTIIPTTKISVITVTANEFHKPDKVSVPIGIPAQRVFVRDASHRFRKSPSTRRNEISEPFFCHQFCKGFYQKRQILTTRIPIYPRVTADGHLPWTSRYTLRPLFWDS